MIGANQWSKKPRAIREKVDNFRMIFYVPDPQFRKYDIRFEDAGRRRRSVEKRHERYKSKKRWYSMGRFTLKGLIKVNIQLVVYCLIYNIEKILNFLKSYVKVV